MRFLSGEDRRAMDYAEASLEHALTVGRLPEVQATFGEGFAETLEEHAFITRLDRHGEVVFPRNLASTNKIPIVALNTGDHLGVDKSWSQSPYQAMRTAEKLESWDAAGTGEGLMAARALVEDMKSYARQSRIKQRAILGQESEGMTYSPIVGACFPYLPKVGKYKDKIFRLRPVIALKREDAFASPLVVYHEWEHAMQACQEPVQSAVDDAMRLDRYRRELGAYHIQSVLFNVLKSNGYEPPDGMSGRKVFKPHIMMPGFVAVDILRRTTNTARKDKFFPNGTLIKELDKWGLDIVGN